MRELQISEGHRVTTLGLGRAQPRSIPLPTTYFAKSAVSERALLGTDRREFTTDGLILRVILRSGPFLTSKAPYASICALRVPPSREGGPEELPGGNF